MTKPGHRCADGHAEPDAAAQPGHGLGPPTGAGLRLEQAEAGDERRRDGQPAQVDHAGQRDQVRLSPERGDARHGQDQGQREPLLDRCPPLPGSVPQPARRAAEGIHAENEPGQRLVPEMLGERDRAQVDRHEHRAQQQIHRGQHHQARAPPLRARHPHRTRGQARAGRHGRRLGRTLGREPQRPGQAQQRRHARPRRREDLGGEQRHGGGTDHEAQLVGDRLEARTRRAAGASPRAATLHRARTMVPSDGMAAPAIAPGTKNAQVGRRNCDGGDQRRGRHG